MASCFVADKKTESTPTHTHEELAYASVKHEKGSSQHFSDETDSNLMQQNELQNNEES